MRLYTHPKLTVDIEEKEGVKYFKEQWKGIINTVVVRDLIYKTIEIYKIEIPKLGNISTNKVLIISDSRKLELIREADIRWLNEVVTPIYEEIGITHQALIPPQAPILSDLVAIYQSQSGDEKFLNYPFENETSGFQWFLHCVKNES